MQTTEDISTTVASKLADLQDVPLAELAELSMVTLDVALGRALPGPQPTPVAAFQSAI